MMLATNNDLNLTQTPNPRKPDRCPLLRAPSGTHGYFHRAAQPGEHPHDPFDGDIAEVSFEQAGNVGLAETYGLRGGGLYCSPTRRGGAGVGVRRWR